MFPPPALAIRLPGAGERAATHLYFGRESITIDRSTFFDIFVERMYPADLRGALILDLGAHKGYFGAYALLKGAAEVWSYEPDDANFRLLQQAVSSFTASGYRWAPHQAAVGGAEGVGELHLSGESWAHSLLPLHHEGVRGEIGSRTVRVTALSDILTRAGGADATRVILKMDIEGAECDVVFATPESNWAVVDEIVMEYHSFAPCSVNEIAARLEAVGLQRAKTASGADDILRFERHNRAITSA